VCVPTSVEKAEHTGTRNYGQMCRAAGDCLNKNSKREAIKKNAKTIPSSRSRNSGYVSAWQL